MTPGLRSTLSGFASPFKHPQWHRIRHRGAHHAARCVPAPRHRFPQWDTRRRCPCTLCIRAGDNGIRWFSEPIVLPPEQSWGGVHLLGPADANLSFRLVGPGWTDWVPIDLSSPILPTNAPVIQLKATSDQGCIERIRIDVNAPSLRLQGVVQGQDPHSTALSVWSSAWRMSSSPQVRWSKGPLTPMPTSLICSSWNTRRCRSRSQRSSRSSMDPVPLCNSRSHLEMRGGYLLEWDDILLHSIDEIVRSTRTDRALNMPCSISASMTGPRISRCIWRTQGMPL